MRISILGPLEVRAADGSAVDIRRGLPRTLLTALALRAGDTVSSDALIEILWGEALPQNPPNALQIQISYLRKTLGAQYVLTRPNGYALDVPAADIDARRFEQMVRTATTPEELDEALALWRGDALVDVAGEPFAQGETTRLTELRWEAVERRNDLLLAQGRHRELIGELSHLVSENPMRERFHEQRMLALYRSGRQADALRCYDDARKVLVEELGIDPGPRLQKLERDILAQDPALDVAEPADPAPPPAAAPPRPTKRSARLPNPVTSLIGREVEMARVGALLERSRMVTLTGPAGGGKSRLAVEVARHCCDPSRVVYVDLVGVADSALVAPTVAAAIGVPVPPDDDAAEVVAAWLASLEHDALLLLDTCEHVLSGAAGLASRALREAPNVRVLATSRRALSVTGEIAWPVPPLALAPPSPDGAEDAAQFPSIELFVRRAASVRPDFALTDANAADVAAICLALDGLPLAIELAAARADVLTPAAIRARLENRFALLVDGSVDAAPRQQTLRAAIDWSYHLLDDDERRLFAGLSVFAGSFDLDAVQAVVADDFDDPLTMLARLVRQSVVMVAGDDRYRLLDSLRAYAADQLGEEGEALRRRHAEHYTAFAETAGPKIRSSEQVEWLERVRQDVPNLRAALAWSFEAGADDLVLRMAGALMWFWTIEGMLDEAAQIFDRAVAMRAAPPEVRARFLPWFGSLVASLGDLHRAREAAEEAAELARAVGDDDSLGYALNVLAVTQWAFGDLKAAARTQDESIKSFEKAHDAWGIGVGWVLRTRTAVDAGEPDVAERARHAVAMARASGDHHVMGLAEEQLARIELSSGDAPAAARHAQEALALHEAIGYTEGMIAALHLLGRARLVQGDVDGAAAAHRRALAMAASINHPSALCEGVEDLAHVAAARGDHESAVRLLAVADRERAVRGIAHRRVGFESDDDVRAAARAALGPVADAVEADAAAVSSADLVRELLADERG